MMMSFDVNFVDFRGCFEVQIAQETYPDGAGHQS